MLEVFKASAGAGKTHRLTGEYIKLLFGEQYAYKHILAVTFTNKATDEMKQRILQELFKLSCVGVDSDYLKEIMEYAGLDEQGVRNKAKGILISILHDYTSFRVSTIDKFFQLVMRSFARELGKMSTYNVELDRDSVLAAGVDRMFSELDAPKNRRLLEWLIDYSLDAVDRGNSWNIRGEIMRLGNQLFSEDFKLVKEMCAGGDKNVSIEAVAQLKGELKDVVGAFEREALELAEKGLAAVRRAGLELEDFKGGSRTPFKYLSKVVKMKGGMVPPGSTFCDLYDNMGKWYSGKKCPAAIEEVYGELNGIVGKMLELFENGYREYASACAVLANVNLLGILNDIYERVQEYCRERNVILLSESAQLLNRIIDDSDTPFVYEKIGAWIDHYMLDEFQDTSSLQWRNFYPLLKESLDRGKGNLVVGDVKQSIYRWRGSDWKILGDGLSEQFGEEELHEEQLDTNYRSGENIVVFNNKFFEYCSDKAQVLYDGDTEGGSIRKIYKGFQQEVSEKGVESPGCVEIEFVSGEGEGFEENVLEKLPSKVEELLSAGYSQKDIAVLVRKGTEGNMVAERLLEYGYDIISSDSLYVGSSVAVQKVVNVLREMDNPQSDSLRILRMFQNIPQTEQIQHYSLYQLCESIIRSTLTEQEKEDVAFLQAFLDMVLDFTSNHGTNIAQFVKWWDESGVKCTISAPDDMDAIRIMTIHKSKGLGFNVVIIPFLTESLDHKPLLAPNLWCSYKGRPVTVKYGKGLMETEFEQVYLQEKLCSYIDALNTVYVAFTRPKQGLVVFAQETARSKNGYVTSSTVSDILFEYYRDNKDGQQWGEKIVIGEHHPAIKVGGGAKKLSLGNVFSKPVDETRMKMAVSSGNIGEEETVREHGIAMHYIFSLVDYTRNVVEAVSRACREGISPCGEAELLQLVNAKISSVEEFGWFDEGWKVYNECSILTPDGDERRPDRVIVKGDEAVVIDYKFGDFSEGSTLNMYKKQVSRYKELLTLMGFKSVKGYLWYLSSDIVISV